MSDVVQPTEGFSYRVDPAQPVQLLAESDRGAIGIRVLESGAQTERQQYDTIDSFVFVRKGQIRVLGENNEVLAKLDQAEGASLTAGTSFVLEATGDSEAELIQSFASTQTLTDSFKPFS